MNYQLGFFVLGCITAATGFWAAWTQHKNYILNKTNKEYKKTITDTNEQAKAARKDPDFPLYPKQAQDIINTVYATTAGTLNIHPIKITIPTGGIDMEWKTDERALRKHPEAMSKQAEDFLYDNFTQETIEDGLKNPIEFVKGTVTPYIKNLQKIKDVGGDIIPLVLLKTRNGKTYLILASERWEK